MPKAHIYDYDKELTAAFKRDCEEFLEEYEKIESLSYSDFAKVWQLKSFTYVFAGQKFALLLKDFCENCFDVVKKFIMFPKTIYTQVGAFYLLYGLYYKQPLKNWVKIRLTFEEYQKVCELIEEMKTRNQYDAVYIFAKMKTEQAFLYVALRRVLGPEDRFTKRFELYYDNTFDSYRTESALSKFYNLLPNSELVNKLNDTNAEYQELLKKYSKKCPSLAPFTSTISSDLQEAYMSFKDGKMKRDCNKEENAIKELRKSIKDKAVASKKTVYRRSRKIKKCANKETSDANSDSDEY